MEKDLEIKSINSVIGKLEPTNILYKNMFDKLKSFDDIFDEVVEKYPNRILDMFYFIERPLTINALSQVTLMMAEID